MNTTYTATFGEHGNGKNTFLSRTWYLDLNISRFNERVHKGRVWEYFLLPLVLILSWHGELCCCCCCINSKEEVLDHVKCHHHHHRHLDRGDTAATVEYGFCEGTRRDINHFDCESHS